VITDTKYQTILTAINEFEVGVNVVGRPQTDRNLCWIFSLDLEPLSRVAINKGNFVVFEGNECKPCLKGSDSSGLNFGRGEYDRQWEWTESMNDGVVAGQLRGRSEGCRGMGRRGEVVMLDGARFLRRFRHCSLVCGGQVD
jgi:hypothetical protein